MDLVCRGTCTVPRWLPPGISPLHLPKPSICPPHGLSFPFCPCSSPYSPLLSFTSHAKKRDSYPQPVLKETTIEEEEEEGIEGEEEGIKEQGGEEEEYIEDFGDETLMDDDENFDDEFEEDDANFYVGDGGGGGGVSLVGTGWDKEALTIAEEVSMSFDGDLKIFAFKTSANSTIRLRIEKLSSKYGSPSMIDIEAFSSAYRARLDEAERAGTIPENFSLEVSSPGVERIVRIPEDLERFKDRPMYVKYVTDTDPTTSSHENNGVFRLVSYDLDLCSCTWGIADVKINRQKAGKGRPLNKKQREWRLQTPFDSLRLVRLHSDY